MAKSKDKLPNAITIRSSTAEYLTYLASTGNQEQAVEMRYADENIWLTQKLMAELYGVSVQAIDQHLKTLIKVGELDRATIKQYLIVQNKKRESEKAMSNKQQPYYNLVAQISESTLVAQESGSGAIGGIDQKIYE